MKRTILVVEDDQMIRNLIGIYLNNAGYDVVEAADGKEAQEAFLAHHPCLIILDRMLPELSGEEFCQWVRDESGQEASIIMVSAKVRTSDRIHGLRMGADDYLTKPFDPEELMAHVEAVLRRTGHASGQIVINGLCIKPKKAEVFLHGEPLNLTKHEFTLLHYFMEHPNMVVNREELINRLYPSVDKTVMDRTIDAHIKKLRAKLKDNQNQAEPQWIQTVRGMGYKFVAE